MILRRFFIATFAWIAVTAVPFPAAGACQAPLPKTTRNLFDDATFVVHALVQSVETVETKEHAVSCNAEPCSMLRLDIEVKEAFRGATNNLPSLYIRVPATCVSPIRVGSEYVFYASATDQTGNTAVAEAGDVRQLADHDTSANPDSEKLIAELKRLALRNSVRGRCRACSSERREK